MTGLPPTDAQITYVHDMQKRLHLPDRVLDGHATQRFGVPVEMLDRMQTSQLLDELIGWEDLPADLQRAKGQIDLPGFGS